MRWSDGVRIGRGAVVVSMLGVGGLLSGCGGEPEVAPEDRMVRVALDPADREEIMGDRYAAIREAIIDIRLMEAARPDPERDREAYATQCDLIDEASRRLVAVMGDERWTRDERRLMQRVLRFASAADLSEGPDDDSPADSESPNGG